MRSATVRMDRESLVSDAASAPCSKNSTETDHISRPVGKQLLGW